MAQYQLLLFGDLNSAQIKEQLHQLLHDRTNPVLADFFRRVSFDFRRLLGRLPAQQQDLFPRFTTLIDLVAKYGDTAGTTVLKFFLLSVLEVAQFIAHFGQGSRQYPSPNNTYIIGTCTGSFAAAAISCSHTIFDLVPVAVEAVLAAFRTGLRSYLIGQSLSRTQPASPTSWSVSVSPKDETTVAQVLATHEISKSAARNSGIWVSATTPTGVTTLSGAPSTLESFIAGSKGELRTRVLDIASPYHAAHIFDILDVEEIAEQVSAEATASYFPRIPLLSSSSGQPIAAANFVALLRTVIHETLREPIAWDLILESCGTLFARNGIRSCRVVPFSSNASSMVSTAMAKAGGVQVDVEEIRLPPNEPGRPTGRFEQSKIAIIGYSGRFPSAASNEAFWELLRAGRDVHQEIPADRFDWSTHYDSEGKKKNTSKVKYGCFIDEPGVFDARFFNMSPREAENTDPAQRLAITTAYEAMEMAGMVRNRTPSTQQDRIGVFFGTTSDDWREVNSGQNIDTYFIPGGNRAFVPGRISYFFRFSGPSLSIDTACSSSFAAIQAACGYLWQGDCDTAVAGGTNVLTNPDNFAGLDRGHFLSPNGNCNSFDDGANGYCRADAVGSVILKRLEDAEADNDPIFGVIVGTNTNHCGQTDSITRPHEGDQSSVFRRIIRYANVNPLDVSYIEMHGTGTQAGDATEMNSVLSVFAPQKDRLSLKPNRPLYLGSAKANVGHAESASGVMSLIKVLMMMKHSEIPPHCGIKTRINHNYPLDLAERGVHIAFKPTPWRRSDAASGTRAVFLNNFSAAGGNTAMFLEDSPVKQTDTVAAEADQRSVHLVAVTAKTAKSLVANINSLVTWLEGHSSVALPRVSYTTTARRMHHNYRAMVSGTDVASILQSLGALAAQDPAKLKPIPPAARAPKVIFMFTGQGTLYHNLGRELFMANHAFQEHIVRLSRLVKGQGFPSFQGLVDGSCTDDLQTISPVVSQLALVCIQIALVDLLRSWGVIPMAVAGHSLGEYAAFYAAGVLSAGDAIYLVGRRATLLEEACAKGTHAMLSVKASREAVAQLMQDAGDCELACANQPTGHVLAGPQEQISELMHRAGEAGLETVKLDVAFAFHSAQVEPILFEFEKAAAQGGVVYHPPAVPVLSPLLAKIVPVGDGDTLNASYLARACRQVVNFKGVLEAARADGMTGQGVTWLEIGPHPTCTGMVKGTLGSQEITLATLRRPLDAYKTITASLEALYLAGLNIDWNEYHRYFPDAHEVLDLPHYAWDLKKYWIQYRNDFCLTKGEGTSPVTSEKVLMPANFKYLSPSVQRVLEEAHGRDQSSLVVESDVFNEKLLPLLEGHRVNGAALCPSSLYADVALTVGAYLLQGPKLPRKTTGLEVGDVNIDKPLIASPTESTHCFRVSAKADWSINLINLSIFSVDTYGKPTTSHATLSVRVVPQQEWANDWKRNTHLITSRIAALERDTSSHRLKQGMAYKLFAALVEYSEGYRGMSEVVLDSTALEAVAVVNFQVGRSEGEYGVDARWIDSLGQVAGFIMNANDAVDSKAQVFINHGWERMRITEELDSSKTYRAYNRMQLVEKTTYVGDTYILHEGRIVAMYEGVKFVGVPRQLLDRVLPNNKTAGTKATTQVPNPTIARPDTGPTLARQVAKPGRGDVTPGPFDRIMAIISQEVGIAPSEMKPENEFADMGIDSLLSLTILSRIREEVGLELASSLFVDHPSVVELQALVDDRDSSDASTSPYNSQGYSSGSDTTSVDTKPSSEDGLEYARMQGALKQVISQETSVSLDDLTPSTCLADIGVDSLLSLTITGTLSELFGAEIPGNMVMGCETLLELEDGVCKLLDLSQFAVPDGKPFKTPASMGSSASDYIHVQKPDLGTATQGSHESIVTSRPHATSILLSGSPAKSRTILFLFPDGSGSASSYAALASAIGEGVAVYGLNCPWRKTAEDMSRLGVNMSQMVAKHLMEVRRVLDQHTQQGLNRTGKPVKTLALGGWSAGGILAMEGVRQLQEARIEVGKLVLIDSPNPIGLQNPPQRMYDFFDTLGIFGSGEGKTPAWLRAHFDAFIRVLDAYDPLALDDAPETLIVYARDGICKNADGPQMETRPDDPREMFWLLNNRTDFLAEGWASLVGRQRLTVRVVDDVNHFTMMDAGSKSADVASRVVEFM